MSQIRVVCFAFDRETLTDYPQAIAKLPECPNYTEVFHKDNSFGCTECASWGVCKTP